MLTKLLHKILCFLGNATAVTSPRVEQLMQSFKVGDKVRIINHAIGTLTPKYIGLFGYVRAVTIGGNYKVRTSIDKEGDDTAFAVLFNFPPEALELVQ